MTSIVTSFAEILSRYRNSEVGCHGRRRLFDGRRMRRRRKRPCTEGNQSRCTPSVIVEGERERERERERKCERVAGRLAFTLDGLIARQFDGLFLPFFG